MSSVLAPDRERGQLPALAFERRHLPEHEIHLAGIDQRPHGVDRMRRGAERVAAMNERDAGGDRVKVEDPVQRRIPAADDDDAAVAEMLHLANGIKDARVLVGVETGERRLLGLERSPARGDEPGGPRPSELVRPPHARRPATTDDRMW